MGIATGKLLRVSSVSTPIYTPPFSLRLSRYSNKQNINRERGYELRNNDAHRCSGQYLKSSTEGGTRIVATIRILIPKASALKYILKERSRECPQTGVFFWVSAHGFPNNMTNSYLSSKMNHILRPILDNIEGGITPDTCM